MAQRADSKQSQVTWQSLNKRQRDYLTAIYHADQEVEAEERSRWNKGGRPRPAIEWRWMVYATLDGHDTPVKRHLRSTKQISEGTGSTLEALEKRKLINVRYDITTYSGREILSNDPIPTIQITPTGRTLVRQALDIRGGRQVAGTLQEWHWRALAKAYAAGSKGVREEGLGYGRIGWNTWLRLRDYKIKGIEYPLIEERNGVSITNFGIAYYERSWERYHNLYSEVQATPPTHPVNPFEPFVEIVQDSRGCRACQGRYLVSITRTYQQDRTWAWSVDEQERRIKGVVTSRYQIKIEQCTCQETDIQELIEPLLPLLDQLSAQGWQLRFPLHHWYNYVEHLVGTRLGDDVWYDAALAKQKLLPLRDDTEMPDDRNIVKGEMRYCYNEHVGKGSIYPPGPGNFSRQPVAVTHKAGEREPGKRVKTT